VDPQTAAAIPADARAPGGEAEVFAGEADLASGEGKAGMSVKIICGDMLVELPKLDADSIDACVTDPPYHLTQASRGGSPLISLLSRCPALL